MFGRNGNANDTGNRSVTVLSPRVSVKGDVAFSGYLRVQGSIVGDVACTSDSQGITVVHGPGSVTGSIKSPNIVIAGRVEGSLDAGELIEVHKGAAVVGAARYKQLVVEKGAIIEGNMTASAEPEPGRQRQERRIAVSQSLADKDVDVALPSGRRASDRFRVGRNFRVAAAVAVAALAALLWIRRPTQDETSAVAVAPDHPADATAPAPEAAAEPSSPPPPAAPPEPAVAPAAAAAPPPAAEPAEPAEAPRVADPNKVVIVRGLNPAKPDKVFFVSTKERCVLFKKARKDAGTGTRIELAKGAKRRFPIATDQVVRVAEGNNLDMYYQGRKISSSIVTSGNWMAFEPLPEQQP